MDACPKAMIFLYTVPLVSKAYNILSPFVVFCSAGLRECIFTFVDCTSTISLSFDCLLLAMI